MDFVRRVEVDAVNQVDHVAQQVAALHTVTQALEHRGDDIASRTLAVVTAQTLEIAEQSGTGSAVGSRRLLGSQKSQQVRAADAVGPGRPVPPAVGRLNKRTVIATGQFGPLLLNPFHVVEELEEHDPGQHGQTVQVAVQALSLRMILRADLMMPSSRCTVVSGLGVDFLRGVFTGVSFCPVHSPSGCVMQEEPTPALRQAQGHPSEEGMGTIPLLGGAAR